MEVKDFLDPRLIAVGLEAKDKVDVIRKMADMLHTAGYLTDKEGFVKDVFYRETLGPTGLDHEIAIPHGKSASVKQPAIAIAKLDQAVNWESLDENVPVRLVFLFAVGDDQKAAQTHLKLLAEIAGKLGNDDVVDRLLEAENCDEIITCLSR